MAQQTPHLPWSDAEVRRRTEEAVVAYWTLRTGQATTQKSKGRPDAGSRGEVTGGQHLNAFIDLVCDLIANAGFSKSEVKFRTAVELPGYYRPSKKWDVVVVRRGRLCAALELKSQVGPSFGNNVNNRTEEALGNSVDLWRAFQAGLLGQHQPWVGYFFFLEQAAGSTTPVRPPTPAFKLDPAFADSSYADRYRILCQRMVLERNYTAATLLLSQRPPAAVAFTEPDPGLAVGPFLKSLYGHLIGCG